MLSIQNWSNTTLFQDQQVMLTQPTREREGQRQFI